MVRIVMLEDSSPQLSRVDLTKAFRYPVGTAAVRSMDASRQPHISAVASCKPHAA